MNSVLGELRCDFASELLQGSTSCLNDFLPSGAQENCTLVVGVPFENRHYEDESIKALETQYRSNFDTLPRRFRTAAGI